MESTITTNLSPDDLAGLIDAAVSKAVSGTSHKKSTLIPITRQVLMERLGVGEATILKYEKQGIIPAIRIGGSVRYDYDEVLECLKERNKKRKK